MSNLLQNFKNKFSNLFKKKPNYPINYVNRELKEFNTSLAYITDIGNRRKENQDAGIVDIFGEWKLLAVADGVASTTGAKLASTCALVKITEYFKARRFNIKNPEEELKNAIKYADIEVKRIKLKSEQLNGDFNPPKTTIVLALVKNKKAYVAWVGDSRAYLINKHGLVQLTKDDSWVEDAVDKGMPLADALKSPMSHAITQCLGMANKELNVHTQTVNIDDCDIMLCSDGLWNYYNNNEKMYSLYSKSGGSSLDKINFLIKGALSSGGGDNITVALYKNQATSEID